MIRDEKGRWVLEHTAQHFTYVFAHACEIAMLFIEMNSQSRAKSREESVSLFSPSESVNLLTKCASYRRFAQASRRFGQTERDERRIWLVSANLSSAGNFD